MDKVVVITGANSGIGYAGAKIYESKGYFVVLGCRNQEKGIAAEKEIGKNSKFIKLDMTDYESIDNFYNNLTSNFKNIDIFYSNAGIMYVPFSKTKEGLESTLATNYFGSTYLTLMMLDLMKNVVSSRIVQISSIAMYFIKEMRYERLEDESIYSPWTWYNYSNLYRTMFAFELDEKLKDHHTKVVVAHPGITKSRLRKRRKRTLTTMGFDFIATNIKTGVAPILEASTSLDIKGKEVFGPGIIHQYGKPRIYKGNKIAYDTEERKKLWNYSVDLTGKDYR